MDDFLLALTALALIRVILSVVVAMALAMALSLAISAFTAGYCIALVIFGLVVGIFWETRANAENATGPTRDAAIGRPVVFLGLSFIGFLGGGVLVEILGSVFWGTAISACSIAAVVLWLRYVRRQAISREALSFGLLSLLVGFSIMVLLRSYAS